MRKHVQHMHILLKHSFFGFTLQELADLYVGMVGRKASGGADAVLQFAAVEVPMRECSCSFLVRLHWVVHCYNKSFVAATVPVLTGV